MTKKKKVVKKNSKQVYMEKKAAIAGIVASRKHNPRVKEFVGLNQITVKNAEGDPETTATLLIQNQINYVPKVSVIIPVYNVEPYLRECLDSIINQTLKEIEIICVDDGSTDSSLDILKEYAAKDKRISVLSQNNYYGGVARNAGLSQAKGEYVHFCDSDDMYPNEQTLELSYTTAIKNKALICGGTMKQLKDGKIAEDPKFNFEKSGIIDFYDYQFIYGYTRFIFNREFLKSHQLLFPKRKRFQDPPFFVKAMHQAGSFYALKEPTYLYRIVIKPQNYFDEVVADIAKGMKDVLNYAKQNNLEKVYNDLYARMHTKFMNEKLSQKSDSGETYLQQIGPKSPFDKQIENIDEIFQKNVLVSSFIGRDYIKFLSPNPENVEEYNHKTKKPETVFIHGSGTWSPQPETIEYAVENNLPLIRIEDGFLRSADTWCNHTVDKKYTMGIAYMFTNDVFYFDATRSSYMERQINDPDFRLTKEQKKRARNVIQTIIDNHLTKYNHQPIFEPKIGREGVPKILVIDQSYGDFSIKQGLADDNTFTDMLESAIKENPGADIIVKTHPDAIAPGTKRPLGYYSTLEERDNLYILREPINPISLIKYVDKVYVCTTQFGFEALMCGKEVHTFGMPFYAGWGLTIDKLKNPRRTAKRTLEEIFYIAYIKNTRYVDPVAQKPCSIERAIEYLIDLRVEYQEYKKVLHPKFSVIIPVYNTEKYLSESIDSVLKQTLQDFEIICINDGSTDNSLAKLKEYEKLDKRIRLIDQKNQGLSCARNNAIKIARGKYVVFLDSDDYLDKWALEKIYTNMEDNGLEMLSYGGINFDDKTKEQLINPYWEFTYIPSGFNYQKFNYKETLPFLERIAVTACLTAYRLDFLRDKGLSFPKHLFFEDNLFFIQAIFNANACGIIKERLYNRRIHSQSITQNRSKHFSDLMKISDMVIAYVKNKDKKLYEIYRQANLIRCINLYNKFSLKDRKKYAAELKKMLRKYRFNEATVQYPSNWIKSYLLFPFNGVYKGHLKNKLNQLLSHKKQTELLNLMRKNQAETIKAFDEIKEKNILLEEQIISIKNELKSHQESLEKKVSDTMDALVHSAQENKNVILNTMQATSLSQKAQMVHEIEKILKIDFARAKDISVLKETLFSDMQSGFKQNQALLQKSETELSDLQKKLIQKLYNDLSAFYVRREHKDDFYLEYRTFGELAQCIRRNIKKVPNDIDLVVGIPRSGIIPAYMIALFKNKKCCSLDEFLAGTSSSEGLRKFEEKEIKKVLIVDDSCFAGVEMNRVKEKLAEKNKKYEFVYMAVYVRQESKELVDFWMEEVTCPRIWQWNYLNHSITKSSCFDLDGVLCQDPTDEENDDGPKYLEFIKNAKPLYIPQYKIYAIVTSRLEKYRRETEEWLKKHNVQYGQLIMLDLPSKEERVKQKIHAKFKAEQYKKLTQTALFVESNPKQAREIALLSGKTVMCVANDEIY